MTSPVSAASPNPATSAKASLTESKKSSVLSSDFETFLKMLTAQARFQDPLEPIDSTEYAAQLAQFSMVEQQVQTNTSLSELMERLSASNAVSLSGWIGKNVRSTAPAEFTGQPITVVPEIAKGAEAAFLVVRDLSGVEVERRPVETKGGAFSWDGMDASGNVLPAGLYSFETESFRGGEPIGKSPVGTYSRVIEAQLDGTEVALVLQGGSKISTRAVSAIRDTG
ncbi:flagellar hook capping FlgD N-terminal domain-containing protein [Primorskyibacter sp. S87]|uniref:flagellar hook capping FlgD N-terminal domain-containing protein n=1 Tax=Primorskyibacter sp. S87 TaxID=3415126 RepID=UPI003C797609